MNNSKQSKAHNSKNFNFDMNIHTKIFFFKYERENISLN